MAFQAGGTDYAGFQRTRDRADEGLTKAQDSAGKAAKQARIKKSGERSGLQKLVSAGVRGAAAYYTGGLSETMGGGAMIDSAMLGTDSEGNAVRNEYGELVGAASQIGGAMSAQKGAEAAKKLEMQSQKDNAMQTRMDNLDPTGQMGMEFAMKRESRDSGNLKALQAGKKGSFGGLVQGDIEGLNYEPTSVGDWESKIPAKPTEKIDAPSPAALKAASLASPETDMGAGKLSDLQAELKAASSPNAYSTYQDWSGNPGSKFVQGGTTNQGVHRSSY